MSEDRRPAGATAGAPREDVVPYERDGRTPVGPLSPGERERRPAPGAGPPESAGRPGAGSRLPRPPRVEGKAATAGPRTGRRRAKLGLARVDPWSVFVLSLLVSACLGVVLVVSLLVLYGMLSSLGVLSSLNTFAVDLQVIKPGGSVIGLGRVVGFGLVLAVVDVVLLTVLATLSAFLYNLCASVTGGIEVVLGERE